ncbi:MAG TPA: sigma-70 family RNA polymerase sigma factor [Pseudonocardiaceae bacterium]|nr:sigma-70 family RNA polymerase sigma factor [Pseudonocardiaceae bacterium]
MSAEEPPWWELTGHRRHGACLIAARAGDRQALNALVVDLNPLVWHVARGQGIARESAEDVVQNVWLTLLRHLDSISEPRALVRWLIVTTRREALRSVRGVDREQPLVDEVAEQLRTREGLPEREMLRHERNTQLWAAYQRLSDRCKHLLRLTVLAGRVGYDGVAEELGMPRGSIGPTRGRCLATLRSELTRDEQEPPR